MACTATQPRQGTPKLQGPTVRGPPELDVLTQKGARSIYTLPIILAAPKAAKPDIHDELISKCEAQPHRISAAVGGHSECCTHSPGSASGTDHLPGLLADPDFACVSESSLRPATCAGAANAAVSVLALESRTATNSASLKGAVEHVHTSVDERDAAHDVGFSFWTNNNSSKQDLGQSANTAASPGSLNPSVAEFKASGAPALRLQGSLQGIPASILIDSGAERDCVSQRFLEHHKITFLAPELSELNVALANGQIQSCGLLHTAHLQIQGYSDCSDFAVTELPNEDLILGMPWLLCTDPQIQWRARTLHFAHQGVEHTLSDSPKYKVVPAISAMEFAHDMKKKKPAWLCVIKPTLAENATVHCGETNS